MDWKTMQDPGEKRENKNNVDINKASAFTMQAPPLAFVLRLEVSEVLPTWTAGLTCLGGGNTNGPSIVPQMGQVVRTRRSQCSESLVI
jgi:hypothetical protein